MRGYRCLWGVLLLMGGCATTAPSLPRSSRTARFDLRGQLVLVDATPVPRADLELRCGGEVRRVTTDSRGEFRLAEMPEGDCLVVSERARLRQPLRVSRSILRRSAPLRLTVPPVHRLELEVRGKLGPERLVLDETLPQPVLVAGHQFALRGALTVDGLPLALAVELAAGRVLTREALTLRVRAVERRAWMPPALRAAPRGGELARVPLLLDRQVTRLALSARNLILLARCEGPREELLDELETLGSTGGAPGLRLAVILTESCGTRTAARGPHLVGGEEVLWALQARPGQLLVTDRQGSVLFRRRSRQAGALDAVTTFLEKSWPPFAAARRVSLSQAASVTEAESERLLDQAEGLIRASRHKEAHLLLDQLILLAPNLAEARQQRALIKARLGDLSGAMNEVSWWRTSFGPEAADDLLEEIERSAKVTTLR